ncbi:hypothetical protein AVEN_219779-1, partial [Araneus ventricosus]
FGSLVGGYRITVSVYVRKYNCSYGNVCKDSDSSPNFPDARFLSRTFPNTWPARSADLNPWDFSLWGFLKDRLYQGYVTNERCAV